MEKNQTQLNENPKKNANFLSILTFAWIFKIFHLGYTKKELEYSDLYAILPEFETEFLGNRIEKKRNSFNKPGLMKVLLCTFAKEFTFNFLCMTMGKIVLRAIEPFLLVKVLSYFNKESNMSKNEAFYWASGLVVLKIIMSIFVHQYYMIQALTAMKVKVACFSLIYRKILKLSKSLVEDEKAGLIVNLFPDDVSNIERFSIYGYYLLLCPIQIIIFTFIIYWELGVAAIAGMPIFLLTIPLQSYVSNSVGKFQKKTLEQTDKRLSLMDEIINGIQVIKMYTWEKPFSELVNKTRKKETRLVKKMLIISAIMKSFQVYIPQLCILATVLAYIALDVPISTASVYMIISFHGQIREDFCLCFTLALQLLNKAMASVGRIDKFLNSQDRRLVITNPVDKFESNMYSIKLLNVSAKWSPDSERMTLNNLNLSFKMGKLTAIIGKIGSGKSSLLQLKEIPVFSGKMRITGRISYAAQEPWVFASSIKQNILFGQPFNEERYDKVIDVCQLQQDMASFSFGDETLIGERGIKLSGGQRARINLARAVYAEADIYIFDDPLSAVDNNVGRRIFENCMCRFLEDKTRILVTHQLQYLQDDDHVIILSDGSVQKEGIYTQIRESDLDIVKTLQIENQENREKMNENVIDTQSSEDCPLEENDIHLEEQEVSELKNVAKYSKGVFWSYLKAVRNVWIVLLTVVLGFTYQTFLTGSDFFLSQWMNLEDAARTNTSLNSMFFEDLEQQREWYTEVFGILLALVAFFVSAFCFIFFEMCVRAAQGLHQSMFNRIIRAPMSFFHKNPSGTISNRFSNDMKTIDKEFPDYMEDIAHVTLQLLAIFVLTIYYSIWSVIPGLITCIILYLLRTIYVRTSRRIKHLEAESRSPVLNHVKATFDGLITIRAQSATDILKNEFNRHQDLSNSAQFLSASAARCFGFYVEFTSMFFIMSVIYLFITFNDNILVGEAGLVIVQCFQICEGLQWAMQQTAELQNQLTSVERILEYADVDQEASFETKPENKPPADWPSTGHVKFNNLSLSYRPEGTAVLKNLNFEILPKEKIGIVGRTGAGKTSLIAALFRLAYNTEGDIYIDNVETSSLGLHDLRSKISIIPQQPVFFAGSLRRNLDPFDEYPDEKLWEAIEEVQLRDAVQTMLGALGAKISDGGSNFSVGQRQLLSLARAVLRNNKILVLDEATANVDQETDELIQSTIRRRFRYCTVFIIAHRLNTVMDCDKFIVMDQGRIVEFDHPYLLLQNQEGYLYKMVQNYDMADTLRNAAGKNYRAKMD